MLICSPWLNKETKRPPVYVDLDTEQRRSVVDNKARHLKDSSVEELEISFTRNINWGSGLGSLRKPESKIPTMVNERGTSNSRRKTRGNSNKQAIVALVSGLPEGNTTAQQRNFLSEESVGPI
ncbi:hypothetical protein DCAR_0830844 [Daucus carota subsp. sativus]|uniref:Uncharacterized protein n=1 Tax=Daucus carota subsp. sativus TaxID=79200 RepID=A0A175YLJ2_DAUCS|nr:hypothetical protein DCAR_0830844 [Daucus carota subsp. sativus]